MHIYSVLNKLFTPKIEQEKVQNNTNEQTQKIQAESKEKILPTKPASTTTASNPINKAPISSPGMRQETCFVSFPTSGDTLATMYNKQKTTLRLARIEAQEKGVRWNKQAVRFLKETFEKKPSFIDIVGKDTDGTLLVELYLDKEKTLHLNNMLLEQDFAMDIKPIVKENNKVSQEPESVIEAIVQQANSELLEVKPKVVDNSLWGGLPEDMDSMPMPDDDYFWQSQMGHDSNLPVEETSNNKNTQVENNTIIEFNPFVDPPIEPLSVYPNGVKPVLEFKEPISEAISPIEVPDFIDTHLDLPVEIITEVKSEIINSLDEGQSKVEFNPFADPPIEPLSVYPNGIKPLISEVIDISPIEDSEHLKVNIPVSEAPNLLVPIDSPIEELVAPIIKPVEINKVDNVELPKESIAIENKINDAELPQEKPPEKVVLKFGSKVKINLPKVEDDIEAALEKKEKENPIIVTEKIADTLPDSVPKIEPEVKTEYRAKHKPASPLSSEYDPFSDTSLDSDGNNNIDVTSLLSDFDSLGEIISEPEESINSKKKKFGN